MESEESIVLHTELKSGKNRRRFTKAGFCYKPRDAQLAENELILLLSANKKKWEKMIKDKTFPLRIELIIYRETDRKWDFHNLIQDLADCMTKVGYIPDDCTKYVGFYPPLDGEIHRKDKNNPRVEIKLL